MSRAMYRSRTSFPGRTVAIAAPRVGLGPSAVTVLRTSFFANVSAAGATGVWTGYLKTGSAFDPCGDLAAIQPQMFDQWAAMYNRYKVNSWSVRIKITGGVSGNAGGTSWVGAIYPAVDSTALTTYQAAGCQAYSKTTSGGFQFLVAGNCPGAVSPTLYLKAKEDAVTGVKNGDTYGSGALVTADPTALQYSVVPIFLQCNAATAALWTLEIDIFQNVTFTNKKNTVDV